MSKIIEYLTEHSNSLTDKERAHMANVLSNEVDNILINLKTLGKLISSAGYSEEFETDTLDYVGCLVEELVTTAQRLSILENNINYDLKQKSGGMK